MRTDTHVDDKLACDDRYVVGGDVLLTGDVRDELRESAALQELVQGMRELEGQVNREFDGTAPEQVDLACQRAIAELAPGAGLEELCGTLDAASFAQASYDLPRRLSNASKRRNAREVARTYAHLATGGIFRPRDLDGFHLLWEAAMVGEPRLRDDFPNSEFRRKPSRVLNTLFSREVMQVCTDPENLETELVQLLAFLGDESPLPEVRAVCGFLSFEFTHPFADGNGHAGRMLLLSTLQDQYSLPTMTCFSRELTLGRLKAARQFALVRRGEHSVADFCHAMLSHLYEAQGKVSELVTA